VKKKIAELHTSGFSIVELVVILAILTTLLGVGTLAFNDWLTKNRVESQVKQIAADIGELRVRAFTRKQFHGIVLNSASYVFKSYSSENEANTAGAVIPGGKTVTFDLKSDAATPYAGQIYQINHRGMLSLPTTIYLAHSSSAALDCLTLHTVRVNVGKTNTAGDNCDDR
jgi:type II secretory pathway pseudopilin PulG